MLSAGIAELRAQDEPNAFFQRADEALYRAKEGGKGRVASETEGVDAPPAPVYPPDAPPYLGTQGQPA